MEPSYETVVDPWTVFFTLLAFTLWEREDPLALGTELMPSAVGPGVSPSSTRSTAATSSSSSCT